MCNWVTTLNSKKLTEHCKPAIMEKNKNQYIKKNETSFSLKKKYFSPHAQRKFLKTQSRYREKFTNG